MNETHKISFGSNLDFVPARKFKKIFSANINARNFVDDPWTLQTVKTSDNMLGTVGINNCSGGVINKIMYHFSTIKENFENLKSFENIIAKNTLNAETVPAILIGSKPKDIPVLNPESLGLKPSDATFDKASEELFNRLRNMIKKFDPTVLEGHNNPNTGTNFIYDVKNDTYYINTVLDMFDRSTSVMNMDDLKKAYRNIYISPRDTVTFTK